MNKFISYDKMSKRERSALDKQKRNIWTVNPIPRVKPSGKVYNRKKKVLLYD